jgi:FkbM family methyltransferase
MLRRLAKSALEIYATRVPYHRGKWRVIEGGLRAFAIEEADRGQEFEVERKGLRWKLGPECAIQRKLYYHGALDPYDEREFLSAIRPGAVFFDVGSYYGYYALRAAKLGARSFAFEPASANYRRLAQNAALNPSLSCETHQLALSDSVGTVAMVVAGDDNRGTGRIGAPSDGSVPTEEVATTTLDRFFRDKGLDRLDAMKLDVEGAELKVLSGGAETLAKFRPTLLMEFNPGCLIRFGVEGDTLLKRVRGLGYHLWRATPGGLVPFQKLKPGEQYCNLLCRAA